MVGYMPKDIEAARKVGAKGILVRTGYGAEHASWPLTPDYIAGDILDAVLWIVRDRAK